MDRLSWLLGVVLASGCALPIPQLLAEKRYREAAEAGFATDVPEDKALVARALTQRVKCSVYLRALGEDDLFAITGFVPQRLAEGEEALVLFRSQHAEADLGGVEVSLRPNLELFRDGYASEVTRPPRPTEMRAAPKRPARGLFEDLVLPGFATLLRADRELVVAAWEDTRQRAVEAWEDLVRPRSDAPESDPHRRARNRVTKALSDLQGQERRIRFVYGSSSNLQLEGSVIVKFPPDDGDGDTVYGPAQKVEPFLIPGEGTSRDRLEAFFAQGPLVLRETPTGFAWEQDPSQRDAAERTFREAIRPHLDPNPHFARGRLLLLVDERARAAADFARAVQIDPADPYYAYWLALASGETGPLEGHAEGEAWTAHLARLILERASLEETLQVSDQAADDAARLGRRCEAYAYGGMLAERAGDSERARVAYEAAVATGVDSFIEHEWAKVRLEQ